MPPGVHLFLTFLIGGEAESSGFMLFAGMMAAAATGAFLAKKGYGPVGSSVAAAWPTVLAAWRHWHWSLDMPSPGGAAQTLIRSLVWSDASVAASVACVLTPMGAAGWLIMRFDSRYKKRTGHSFFEER